MSKWLTQEWLDETRKMSEGQPSARVPPHACNT